MTTKISRTRKRRVRITKKGSCSPTQKRPLKSLPAEHKVNWPKSRAPRIQTRIQGRI